tara:strand:+ start:4247 stop:5020 length:774 start_codon:yes stop_codon:yes gene_type:complete
MRLKDPNATDNSRKFSSDAQGLSDAAGKKKSRSKAQGDETRAQLIDAAERLFAQHGIEGISLRAISVAAKQSNNVAVQYHFGDRMGLIDAIFAKRTPQIERRRSELFTHARGRQDKLDVKALVEILFLPLTEMTEADGHNIYAQFLLHFLNARMLLNKTSHPLGRQRMGLPQQENSTTFEAVQMIINQLPDIPESVIRERILLQLHSFLSALVNWERFNEQESNLWPLNILIIDQIDIISTILSMPVSSQVAEYFNN